MFTTASYKMAQKQFILTSKWTTAWHHGVEAWGRGGGGTPRVLGRSLTLPPPLRPTVSCQRCRLRTPTPTPNPKPSPSPNLNPNQD